MNSTQANALINESSPYLLQHAYNPVQWLAWNEEAWEKARNENKPVIISIGYAACHWCHVMEKESFEDQETADIMNRYFICIKVDREERPDIDMIYMQAVQLMTGQGGWPLNCITLPDGRPVYGGTYFPKFKWQQILQQLHQLFSQQIADIIQYAEKLKNGLQEQEKQLYGSAQSLNEETIKTSIHNSLQQWKTRFDFEWGGPDKSPKFPMPVNYTFLLRQAFIQQDKTLQHHVAFTLQKMAKGGIYDQLEGGFSRYAVDERWHVPHFEKMLYDNAQLISLYAEAYAAYKNPYFKQIARECIHFCESRLQHSDFLFYAALDADTQGEEGKTYTWNKTELQAILKDAYPLFAAWYRIDEDAHWEEDKWVLQETEQEEKTASEFGLSIKEARQQLLGLKEKLLHHRHLRPQPAIDTKRLAGWNALMLKAYCDAYRYLQFPEYKEKAGRLYQQMTRAFFKSHPDGICLIRSAVDKGNKSINGFLEDYALCLQALQGLYTIQPEETLKNQINQLWEYTLSHFPVQDKGYFPFTDKIDPPLFSSKVEINDNVIPSSNSIMAHLCLDRFMSGDLNIDRNTIPSLIAGVHDMFVHYGEAYANWGNLIQKWSGQHYWLKIVGKDVNEIFSEFSQHYLPNTTFVVEPCEKNQKPYFQICGKDHCYPPMENVQEVLHFLCQALS